MLIILFAALGYALSEGTRTGEQNLSDYNAELAAAEVLTYARSIKDAVKTMQIDGCDNTEISFQTALLSGYSNPNSPTDNSCHVFHPNGGGLFYQRPANNINGGADLFFTGANDGSEIGTQCNAANCADLFMIYPDIPRNVCQSINEKFDIASGTDFLAQENDSFAENPFVGTYSYNQRLLDGANAIDGKTTGCIQGNTLPQNANTYYFFQVLIAR